MKKYCVDLEIAKELKENGFRQNTKYRYEVDKNGIKCIGEDFIPINDHIDYIFSAPTSDEILEKLPKNIETKDYLYFLYIDCQVSWFTVYYKSNSLLNVLHEINENKLSNTLAKMWLHLKKEGYING